MSFSPKPDGSNINPTRSSDPKTPPRVLSIQSWVAHGHVGNAAAVFVLQRLGLEVDAIHTVQFSNHTGYGAWTGNVYAPESIGELVDGIEARGALEGFDALLSGYMGSAGTIEQVVNTVRRVRQLNPKALYCCDPVMGDTEGLYVRPEIPEVMAALAVPAADILTPNQFELELFTGSKIMTLEDALRAVRAVREKLNPNGPRIVILTSLIRVDATPETIETLALTDAGVYLIATPKIALEPPRNGTGDTITALFLGHYLKSQDVKSSLERAVNALYRLLEITQQKRTREIQLIAAQDELLEPSSSFEAELIS
jgi:pyridoxine kinase